MSEVPLYKINPQNPLAALVTLATHAGTEVLLTPETLKQAATIPRQETGISSGSGRVEGSRDGASKGRANLAGLDWSVAAAIMDALCRCCSISLS